MPLWGCRASAPAPLQLARPLARHRRRRARSAAALDVAATPRPPHQNFTHLPANCAGTAPPGRLCRVQLVLLNSPPRACGDLRRRPASTCAADAPAPALSALACRRPGSAPGRPANCGGAELAPAPPGTTCSVMLRYKTGRTDHQYRSTRWTTSTMRVLWGLQAACEGPRTALRNWPRRPQSPGHCPPWPGTPRAGSSSSRTTRRVLLRPSPAFIPPSRRCLHLCHWASPAIAPIPPPPTTPPLPPLSVSTYAL